MKTINIEYRYTDNNGNKKTDTLSCSISHYMYALLDDKINSAYKQRDKEVVWKSLETLLDSQLDCVLVPECAPEENQRRMLFYCLHAFGYFIMSDLNKEYQLQFLKKNKRTYLVDKKSGANMSFHLRYFKDFHSDFGGKNYKTYFDFNNEGKSISRGNNNSFIINVYDPESKKKEKIKEYIKNETSEKKKFLNNLFKNNNGLVKIDVKKSGINKIIIANRELEEYSCCEDKFNKDRTYIYVVYDEN